MGKLISLVTYKKEEVNNNKKKYDDVLDGLNIIDYNAVNRALYPKESESNIDNTLLKASDFQKMIDCFETMEDALSIISGTNADWGK